jgi:hypothetical protein
MYGFLERESGLAAPARRLKTRIMAVVAAVLAMLALSSGAAVAAADPGGDVLAFKASFMPDRNISLPNKSDLTLQVLVEIDRNDMGEVYALIQIGWEGAGVGSGHKFDGFHINARLERRSSPGGTDTVINHSLCDATDAINSSWAGTYTCYSYVAHWNSSYYWTSDGSINYDVDNDGKGYLDPAWELGGSPQLS